MAKAVKLSPMMAHYKELKKKYSDTILLYRLGDFYEMFFDDAKTASKILDLTLTGRDCGLEERAPMCGVPYHAVDNYVTRLLNAGLKVAICEQLTNPGDQKGMVKRDVVRVITPGTNTNEEMLDATVNHYLCSVAGFKKDYAVGLLDIVTGEFSVRSFPESVLSDVEDYLLSNAPSEIISDSATAAEGRLLNSVISEKIVKFTPYYDYAFDFDNACAMLKKHFGVFDMDALDLADKKAAVCAAGGIIDYVYNTQKRSLGHIKNLSVVGDKNVMTIDYNTRRNLELTESQADNKKAGSLLWVLDKTKTGMGARLLRHWVLNPLTSAEAIEERQQAVGELIKNASVRSSIGSLLSEVRDLERLVTKISYGTILPRDCLSLSASLKIIPFLKQALSKLKAPLINTLNEKLGDFSYITDILDSAIDVDCPATTKDGGYIKNNFNEELDCARALKNGAKQLIDKFEEDQRVLTGVAALKVRYNRIFGYYIEIPNSKKPDRLPADYMRKQTIANGERYVNDELMRLEKEILGSSDKILELEEAIYTELKTFLASNTAKIQLAAEIIANTDCLYSLAEVAYTNNYVRPKFLKNSKVLHIQDGRHPVVEKLLNANDFVANDLTLDKEDTAIIITGPNMAGKSTYIRQVALLALMAHIGSFVPAAKMELGLIDRIFTRVGASDNLSRGQSTFMVEMLEMANILNNATSSSLLILDEIGRGTSTLDGLSIAWAIVEYLVIKTKAKTLFATHYHELTELEKLLPGIKNYRILVHEQDDGISFLYKIARGGANKSFGIEVAKIAGINDDVINRSKDILNVLSATHELKGDVGLVMSELAENSSVQGKQMTFFAEDERFTEIKNVLNATDVNRCTPIEALTILSDLKKIIKK